MSCQNCNARCVGCHATCASYLSEKETKRKENEWLKQKRRENMDICRKMVYTFNR